MCRAVRCKVCAKTTWAGCGEHVDQVMARVPSGDRCPGHEKPSSVHWWQRLMRQSG
jgi:hypothetical protein